MGQREAPAGSFPQFQASVPTGDLPTVLQPYRILIGMEQKLGRSGHDEGQKTQKSQGAESHVDALGRWIVDGTPRCYWRKPTHRRMNMK